MAKKHECDFYYVHVTSRGRHFMVDRCEKCGKFGHSLIFCQKPFDGAPKITLKEVPKNIRGYINIIAKQSNEIFKLVDVQIYLVR